MKLDCSTNLPCRASRKAGRLPEMLDESDPAWVGLLVPDGCGNPVAEGPEANRFSYRPLESTDDQMIAVQTRCYDPTPGRWVEQDPVGFQGNDSNLHRYVSCNPRGQFLGEDGQLHDA